MFPIRLFTGFVSLLFLTSAAAADSWNMPRGVTDISASVYGLHMMVFWVCVAIAVVVFGVMFWSLYFYRKSRNYPAATFSHNTKAEVIWTTIPIIILVVLAIPAVRILGQMYDTSVADVNIKVTGHQWKWEYEYIEDDIHFFSNLSTRRDAIYAQEQKGENYLLEVDHPLVIPTNQKVRFLITSNDVIHSWWVPDFAVKRDAIPGFMNEAWVIVKEPGIYRGQCAELCGVDHGFMPIVVDARAPQDYQQWLAEQSPQQDVANEELVMTSVVWNKDTLIVRGQEVYTNNCLACHQANGQGLPPTFPALNNNATVLDDDVSVLAQQILNGKGAMPAFAWLQDEDIAAVMTYLRNAWDNRAAVDVVMPEQVNDYR